MDELEALKKKKLEELQRQQSAAMQEQVNEEAQVKQQIEQLEMMVKQVFTKEALIRYGNVKAAYPEKAVHVLVVLGQLLQQGKVKHIDDEQLKGLLQQLTPEKKDFKIKRK